MTKHCAILLCLLSTGLYLQALTDTAKLQPDIRRAALHDDIDREQGRILAKGSPGSPAILRTEDKDLHLMLTDLFTRKVDRMQEGLETTGRIDHRLKVKYLSGLRSMLSDFRAGCADGEWGPQQGAFLFTAFSELVSADTSGRSILPLAVNLPYEVGKTLLYKPGSAFNENVGFPDARVALFRKMCAIHPESALAGLEAFPYVDFADSLISVFAKRYPNRFYDYAAAAQTNVGKLIRKSDDPLVRTITSFSESRSGRLYFPFLDEVVDGRLKTQDIDTAMADSLLYFRLLVSTQVSYAERARRGDTPFAAIEMPRMLKRKAEEVYINTINGLHDETDAVRFRILEPLNPQELYYLIVMGEEVIYTSSYKGVYKRMMARLPAPAAGDRLLMSVRFDRFKKFIKMAAGYNTLDHFLSTMPDSNAQRLMIAFARGLGKSQGLEEAVDVADSYGSISTPAVKALIDREIQSSLEEAKAAGNRRSVVIYDILNTILRSSTDSSIDLSARLGIPPVYKLTDRSLRDTADRIVQLAFFYGDKDGKESFANFMGLFQGKPEWSVTRNREWVEIRSVKGRKVWIFANLPLDNSDGSDPDAKAQRSLLAHLETQGLDPAVVIHRGHSYHLKYTLDQLPESAQIVILGSCGGFHNLDDVLNTCPDAHIISSKEVGTRVVNEPILRSINEHMRNGKDIEWIPIWRNLSSQFTSPDARERFENYIPPHKNLGALFIKAYHRAMRVEP
jgi:hypothetical protein